MARTSEHLTWTQRPQEPACPCCPLSPLSDCALSIQLGPRLVSGLLSWKAFCIPLPGWRLLASCCTCSSGCAASCGEACHFISSSSFLEGGSLTPVRDSPCTPRLRSVSSYGNIRAVTTARSLNKSLQNLSLTEECKTLELGCGWEGSGCYFMKLLSKQVPLCPGSPLPKHAPRLPVCRVTHQLIQGPGLPSSRGCRRAVVAEQSSRRVPHRLAGSSTPGGGALDSRPQGDREGVCVCVCAHAHVPVCVQP